MHFKVSLLLVIFTINSTEVTANLQKIICLRQIKKAMLGHSSIFGGFTLVSGFVWEMKMKTPVIFLNSLSWYQREKQQKRNYPELGSLSSSDCNKKVSVLNVLFPFFDGKSNKCQQCTQCSVEWLRHTEETQSTLRCIGLMTQRSKAIVLKMKTLVVLSGMLLLGVSDVPKTKGHLKPPNTPPPLNLRDCVMCQTFTSKLQSVFPTFYT